MKNERGVSIHVLGVGETCVTCGYLRKFESIYDQACSGSRRYYRYSKNSLHVKCFKTLDAFEKELNKEGLRLVSWNFFDTTRFVAIFEDVARVDKVVTDGCKFHSSPDVEPADPEYGYDVREPSVSEQMQGDLEPLPSPKWDGHDIGPVLKHGRE
jgi:hypothetical protein